jgi:sulfur carrier protein
MNTASAPVSIEVVVNGSSERLPLDTSVRELLGHLGLGGARIAVAVNRRVVPRSSFETHRLAAGDRIEILEAVGGGR